MHVSQHSSISSEQSVSTSASTLFPVPGAAAADLQPPALYDAAAAAAADAKLTKAQKKNLRRAEKKAQKPGGGAPPTEGSESSSIRAGDVPLVQRCMAAIAHYKAMCLLQSLMAMGFNPLICVAAIRHVGVDAHAASGWILDRQIMDRQAESFAGAGRSWCDDAASFTGPATSVDVSGEMQMLERVVAAAPGGASAQALVMSAVVDARGDVEQALLTVLAQVRSTDVPAWSGSGGHVATAGALAVLNET